MDIVDSLGMYMWFNKRKSQNIEVTFKGDINFDLVLI